MKTAEKTIQDSYLAVGVMSGTSVDGLDIALCRFERIEREKTSVEASSNKASSGKGSNADNSERVADTPKVEERDQWDFKVLKTRTLSYSGTDWPERLANAEKADGYTLMEVHRDFGRFTGEAINNFLADFVTKTFQVVDLIASHGHTIFHRPEKGITLQIGDGAEIASVTGITTVSDFRRLDVALQGQGAPLVPIGDELLFGSYDFCLNLGGFANISFRESGKRVAFDICPANIVLNRLAGTLGKEYDKGGETARSGKVLHALLKELENLEFYQTAGPRSLGKEWVEEVFMPVMDKYDVPAEDKLRTVCEHIALRIAAVTGNQGENSGETVKLGNTLLLATGGGAKNDFLMELIAQKTTPVQVIIPDEEIVDFKEAIVFAFLGVLRLRNEPNCLASVTGARHDNSGGVIHLL